MQYTTSASGKESKGDPPDRSHYNWRVLYNLFLVYLIVPNGKASPYHRSC